MTQATIKDALVALQPQLRRFAYGLTGSMDEAADLVQASYARALGRLHQWQSGTRLDSWMYSIVRSVYINQYHAAKKCPETGYEIDTQTYSSDASVQQTEAQLTLAAIRQFILQLPEEQRSVLLLITVEGLSYKETSELLGLPIGTVTSRLARARLAINTFVNGA